MLHIGIDFGAKLAGTTVICWLMEGKLYTDACPKKVDADQWLVQRITDLNPQAIYIDAPLSIPAVYGNPTAHSDYFYRKADRLTQAMSPMFLGGLTARAMQLRRTCDLFEIRMYEVYPGFLVKSIGLTENYNKKDPSKIKYFLHDFAEVCPNSLAHAPDSWHAVDAVLAWWSGFRHINGLSIQLGDEAEGVIIV